MNPHRSKSGSPWAMLASLRDNRGLILALAKRDVIGRYRGSLVGLGWSFFNPLLMLAIYTFVFSVVFKARWADAPADKGTFAVILFVGILVHGVFAECVNRAPTLILSNAGYVKRVVFPLEVLPWVAMASTLFHAAVTLAVLLLAEWTVFGAVPWTAVFSPMVLLPLVLTTMGLAWLLAALGVFVRDIGQITITFTTIALFLSPVFYPVTALPEGYRAFFMLNPITFIIEQMRDVLIWGKLPAWGGLLVATSCGTVIAWFGFWVFQRMRKGFSDVL